MSPTREAPRLTVGMACYDDFEGVWFSVTALRMYHADLMPAVEILVVDNNPGSAHGMLTRQFIENWVDNGRYVPFTESVGTAAPREQVFRQARGEAVLCMDAHVLLGVDALRRLLDYYAKHPDTMDLLQGPMVHDDLKTYSSHFEDQWRDEMWGTWATDPRAAVRREVSESVDPRTGARQVKVEVLENPPFDIPAQGLGVFSCRKAAWLGFHPDFRGFGGEEFYIHEKFRRAGRRTLCLPFLRWVHRFNRPGGVPYGLTIANKFRNYVIGLTDLGMPLEPAIEHFSEHLPEGVIRAILQEVGQLGALDPRERRAAALRARIAVLEGELQTLEGDREVARPALPMVSCQCLTYGRVERLNEAVECFLRQDYAGPRELVILNTLPEQRLVFDHPQVRIINCKSRPGSLGECRNLCVEACRGEIILVWDDDDLYLPGHIALYARHFRDNDWISLTHDFHLDRGKIVGMGTSGSPRLVAYTKAAWRKAGRYAEMNSGEDQEFNARVQRLKGVVIDNPTEPTFCYGWNNGVWHISGGGGDEPGEKTGWEKSGEYMASRIAAGKIPTGEVHLTPGWERDYVKMARRFGSRRRG